MRFEFISFVLDYRIMSFFFNHINAANINYFTEHGNLRSCHVTKKKNIFKTLQLKMHKNIIDILTNPTNNPT